MKEHLYYVYIVANTSRQLYTGFTSTLRARILDHKAKTYDDGFTTHWDECRLVYYECTDSVHGAIGREKQIKRWRREKKLWIIESINPNWHDLSEAWFLEPTATALPLDSALKRSARGDSPKGWEGKGQIIEKRKKMIERLRRRAGVYKVRKSKPDK